MTPPSVASRPDREVAPISTSFRFQPDRPSTESKRSRRMNRPAAVKNGMPRSELAADGVALVDRPVEAEHALVALDAWALDHDVVARLGVVVGVVAAAEQHVVADDRAVEEQLASSRPTGCRSLRRPRSSRRPRCRSGSRSRRRRG